MKLTHLKERCAACEQSNVKMNKEHVFPQWLIKKTNTNNTGIRWGEKKIPALSVTIPLCVECNKVLGKELESPVSNIFDDLEAHKGISDLEAELLVRWLWKIQGLFWIAGHPDGIYTTRYTLKERVLNPIDKIRGNLILCASLIDDIDNSFNDRPMGLDSLTEVDAIFVSGVFSMVALMVILDNFSNMVPDNFSQYTLLEKRSELSSVKLFYPKTGFDSCVNAVGRTVIASKNLAVAHDKLYFLLNNEYKIVRRSPRIVITFRFLDPCLRRGDI